ncbi:hypothetical protein SLUN_04795 [Streptomyces lunaelactis]|uniref:WXG100 family type VII secretion target n=1 Tax=Streptomyces lunaelactis TaxID=1535768 RepID=A0A2R4SXM1_9ACTN|nr:hypothetical protein [Streptomyces lunaelactis]AVZ71609.1 hypothetical protein SLUN_04795 [Streptomyces lunaelactis]NUK89211.1 hypothetical protein [Streptomyces lunaelactis]NUL07440.1 hypothetical protein [Streptomyces lunaelactis]
MPTYGYNRQELEYAVGEMAAMSARLQETLRVLGDGATMRLEEWTGDVRNVYNGAKIEWDSRAQAMVTQANNATSALGVITDAYHQGERHGTQLWEL